MEPNAEEESATTNPSPAVGAPLVTIPTEAEEEEDIVDHGLGDLLSLLENYTPVLPDSLTLQYLHRSGFDTVDPRIVRVISVLSQKFISDIINDSLQHCKTRTSNSQHSGGHNSNKDKKLNKDRKYALAMEDLAPALADHGITVRKPQYFV